MRKPQKFSLAQLLIYVATICVGLGLLVQSDVRRKREVAELNERLAVQERLNHLMIFEIGCLNVIVDWQTSLALADHSNPIHVNVRSSSRDHDLYLFHWQHYVGGPRNDPETIEFMKQQLEWSARHAFQESGNLSIAGYKGHCESDLRFAYTLNGGSRYLVSIRWVVD